MASFEITREVHEITVSVALTDDAPSMTNPRGLVFKPHAMQALWVRENAGKWECIGAEVFGRVVNDEDDPIGFVMKSSFRLGRESLPDWADEIVNDTRPIEVMTERVS